MDLYADLPAVSTETTSDSASGWQPDAAKLAADAASAAASAATPADVKVLSRSCRTLLIVMKLSCG